jgi:membrane protease YdiL (CAAX protease family)
MKIKAFAERHSVWMYFSLAFLISWGGSLAGWGGRFLRGESIAQNETWLMGLVMLSGPFFSGITMAALVNGRQGLRNLFAGMGKWRVGIRWYAALLLFPALILGVLLVLVALGWRELTPTFFAPGILMGIGGGLIEETGWMGFAFPRMRRNRGVLSAAAGLGLIHAAWHFLPDYMMQSVGFGRYWLPYFAGFFVFVSALRFLIMWAYANTGSLLVAQLMHGFSSGSLGILVPIGVSPQSWAVFYPVYAIVMCAVAAIVIGLSGRELVRARWRSGAP